MSDTELDNTYHPDTPDLPWWALESTSVHYVDHSFWHQLEEAGESTSKTREHFKAMTIHMVEAADELSWFCRLAEDELTPEALWPKVNKFGSNARLQWLVQFYPLLPDATLRAMVPKLWVDPNMAIGGPANFTAEVAYRIFERTGFISDGAPPPTEPQRVYHGVWWNDQDDPQAFISDHWSGLAWTSSLDVARIFAKTGGLYATTVTPDQVLARFDSRDEHEWVIDLRTLDIDSLEKLEHTPDD